MYVEVVTLIVMGLKENYNMTHIGKNLSDAYPT